MTYPNTLIFVDLPSTDPEASARFYAEVFGWEVEPRPAGVFHRIVPGQHFLLDDGSEGPTGNLHMGIYNVANARPHPDAAGVEPRHLSQDGRTVRVWILVSDDDHQDRILETAERHSDIEADCLYVDAAGLRLVRAPWEFDVFVTENMFGDILSDVGAAVIGGMGMAPSADIGDDHAVFQPCHGTAPDIAGRGVANPTAMFLSAAMMLEWLGYRHEVPGCLSADRSRPDVEIEPDGVGYGAPDLEVDAFSKPELHATDRRLVDADHRCDLLLGSASAVAADANGPP